MLTEHGHNPIPVAPVDDDILGRKVFKSLSDIKEPLDTVTVITSYSIHYTKLYD